MAAHEAAFIPLNPSDDSIEVVGKYLDQTTAEELARKCVHAIIILGQEQNVIKKTDLNRIVFPEANYRVTKALIEIANFKLNNTFGMRLYQLATADTKFILVNTDPEFSEMIEWSESQNEYFTTLFFVLLEIFGSPENRSTMDELMKTLQPMNIDDDNLKEYFDGFLKKLYLIQKKQNDKIYYSWGPRAEAEIDPDKFFTSFLNLNGSSSDDVWPDQKARIEALKRISYRYKSNAVGSQG